MTLMWTRMKIVVEPSSAVPLAAVLANRELFSGKKVAIVSGGNADLIVSGRFGMLTCRSFRSVSTGDWL
jgi:threonine dehydratase